MFAQLLLDARPDGVPVALRLAAEGLVDDLHVVEQVRAGVEESSLVLDGHLVAQPQRPLDGDAGVAKVGVVENLRRVAVAEPAVKLHDLGDLVAPVLLLADLAALGAEAAAHGNVEGAGIEQLDLALAALLLAV